MQSEIVQKYMRVEQNLKRGKKTHMHDKFTVAALKLIKKRKETAVTKVKSCTAMSSSKKKVVNHFAGPNFCYFSE